MSFFPLWTQLTELPENGVTLCGQSDLWSLRTAAESYARRAAASDTGIHVRNQPPATAFCFY